MKRLTYILTCFIASLGAVLSGCSDEIDFPDRQAPEELYDGIVLRVPDPAGLAASGATRASAGDAEAAETEGKITELYLLAFPTGSETNGGAAIISNIIDDREVLPIETHTDDHAGFNDYDITALFKNANNTIKTGEYKIYVCANLSKYLPAGTNLANISKNDLDDLKLNFISEDGNTYLLAKDEIDDYGLPMAASGSDIYYRDTKAKSFTQATNGKITITNSAKGAIHADLTFLCSKVRYTLLFDNGSFSKDMFKDLSWKLTGVSGDNLPVKGYTGINEPISTATADARANCAWGSTEYDYPSNASEYPANKDDNLKRENDYTKTFSQRAFQGVMYLPENVNETSLSKLIFNAQVMKSATEQGAPLKYTMNLLPKEVDNSVAMKRGQYYDIVAKVTGVETLDISSFEVHGWDPTTLTYSLGLPSFLEVEKTDIPVIAGQSTEMWYDSNVSIQSQSQMVEVNGKNIDLFKIDTTTEPNKIKVSVNPEINADDYKDITLDVKDGEKTGWFKIQAGNIIKTIDVSPLMLSRFLTVDPTNFTIDAREKIANGSYSSGDNDVYEINIDCNLSTFYIENVTWKDKDPGEALKLYKVVDGLEVELKFDSDNGKYTITNTTGTGFKNGTMKLHIKYAGVNGDNAFWNSANELSFKISAENGGLTPGNADYIAPQTVTVNTRSNTDNYTVYFHAPSGWTQPHIYIYQCLELPAKYYDKDSKTYVSLDNVTTTNGTYDLRNYPVGVKNGVNAALEYCFTGGIIFKGWDESENLAALKNIGKGFVYQGFYMFEGNNVDANWNPTNSDASKHYFKGSDYDFYKSYRGSLACSNCNTYENNRLWPGICMKSVGDNWWTIEIPAVATPGKTLIMFKNGHASDDNSSLRYPGDNKVGVPLFEYPTRTGYFDYANGKTTFSPTDPRTGGGSEETTSNRVYFTNPDNWSSCYAYVWTASGKEAAKFPGKEMTKTTIDGTTYWYYDIPTDQNYVNIIFSNGSDKAKTGNLSISSTKNVYNKTGAISTIGGGGGGEEPSGAKKYRLYWQYEYGGNKRNYLCSWENSSSISFPVQATYIDTYGNWCYYEWTETKETFSFKCRAATNDNYGGESAEIDMDQSKFTYNSTTGCYENTTYKSELKPK